jgi:hypothetical protein
MFTRFFFITAPVILAALLLLQAGQAVASGIYRWVDEHGYTHFGDRPPLDEAPEEVELRERTPLAVEEAPSAVRQSTRREKQQRLLNMYREEREEKREAAEKRERETREREIRCAAAKDRLNSFEVAGFLYEPGSDGGRRILSDEEHEQAMERAREAVVRWCE